MVLTRKPELAGPFHLRLLVVVFYFFKLGIHNVVEFIAFNRAVVLIIISITAAVFVGTGLLVKRLANLHGGLLQVPWSFP